MKVFHLFLLLLFVGPSWFKPLEDDDPGNKDAAASDPPPDAGNGDGGDNGDKAGNADGGGGNGDNAAPSDDGDKKDKDASKDAGDAEPAAADISPADDKGGDDKGDKKPTTGPTPTPTGKTPNKTPTPTGKTPTPTKGPTSKPTTAPADNKDKVADDAPAPTTGATTNKPSTKHTSPSPRSSTKPPKSTPNPTIIKKASIPSSPKPTTAATTKAKTTAATTHPTTAAPTHKPTKAATSKAPEHEEQDADQRSKIYRNNDGYGQTVEKSNNNTLKMNGTTFRVAVRLLEEKWTEDLNYQKNPVFQSLKKTVMSAVAVVYDGYHDFKQIAIIGFTETPANDSDADKRDSIVGNSVIADFYLRFFSFGKHLKKLTDAVKNEKIGTLTVSPKFVKAYTAEPRGRVCTPDCKSRCYYYCDKGCCNENSLMRRNSLFQQHRQQQQQQHRQSQSTLGVIPPRNTICRDLDLACLLGTEPRFADPPPAAPRPHPVAVAKKFAVSGPAQRRSNTCSGPQCLLKYALNPPARLPNVKQCHGDVRCETRLVVARKNVVGKSPPARIGSVGSFPDFFQNSEKNRASFMVRGVPDPMESHLVRSPGPDSAGKLFMVEGPSVSSRTNILGRPYSPFFPRGRAPVVGGGVPFTRHIQNAKQQLTKNTVVSQVPEVSFTLNND